MSLWSQIFGSPSFIDKSLDALAKSGDAMFFYQRRESSAQTRPA